ncbi:GGDEF & EAL domain-containing protein [Sulfurospirillum diekertiae]|uniref:GGDEF & EAL domain-containing protein n=1 Tax=Sulfurospirillum diekertiae TaxID=1854492 RepID=A0A290HRU7_9BACT|nr:GGDEF domain-containing protein [Sulfurospirillum diekertiae]ATB68139.1 GGDEF & EAL domain-containing protein [Sulfurospirillum diekertiae]
MLYSEIKERENRFITALKIAFPFLLLIGIFFHAFQLFPYTSVNFILLILLIPIYVYYTVYLIYHGFQTTLIDPTTKTFTRMEIMTKIENIKDRENTTIIFLHVNNFSDINERYGIHNGDILLFHFIQKLEFFLREHHFKNVSIGRYSNDSFLFYIKNPSKELRHLLTIFTKSVQNVGISNIEIKVDFSLLSAAYDSDTKNIIEHLLMLIEEQKKSEEIMPNIKLNQFQMIIDEAIKYHQLFFKYQPSLSLETEKIEIVEVLTRMESQTYGLLSKQQIQRIVNHTGYEKIFDEKVFELLVEEILPLLEKEVLLSIEISPVTLRNLSFKHYLITLFEKKNIAPNRFILEFTEKKSYENMHRFREIIESYQEVGFKIALGNFGGNNCSFEYLKHLPIDLVKFDIEFTKKIDDSKYQQLLLHYVELIQTLHIQSMVKFVDKEAYFQKMKEMKPDYIQGFCISKPKNLEQIVGDIL